jgi:hypothetical protein
MEFANRLFDALLGSPIPPPNWLDPRHASSGWEAPAGFFAPSYHVPAERIRAEFDELSSCVNPPVIQGWTWCLALVAVGVVLSGLASLKTYGLGDALGIAALLGPIPAWFLADCIGASLSHDIELRDDQVVVMRWTDVWLGRPGRLVGSRASVHAVLSCGNHVQLSGDAGTVEVSMTMWPRSSRQALEVRLERWEIELEFPGRHHVHHPAHWNHGHHRIAHPLPEQGQHRHGTVSGA